MKYAFFAVLFSMVVAGSLSASPQDIGTGDDHITATAPNGNEVTPAHAVWHCTAYPEGHGHDHGYSAVDAHYSHAYYGAIRACERATGHHCHDVHCHHDHD